MLKGNHTASVGTETESERVATSLTRRSTLKTVGYVGSALLGGVGAADVGGAQQPSWTIVALPDTQNYTTSESRLAYARDQTEWIAANAEAENVAFVTQEGDLVSDGSALAQWERIDSAFDVLDGDGDGDDPDGLVPYATAIGDHDWFGEEDRSTSTRYYRQFFGASRYEDRSWFGGSAPNDLSHYQRFSAGGYDFLHMDLEWEAPGDVSDPDSPLGWAQGVLDDFSETPTILTTHSYLWDEPDEEGRTDFVEEVSGDGSSGERLYRELVAPNPQVFMVLCGNFHQATGTDDGEWAQVSRNDYGLDVYELLADYQDYPNGGNGWLRLVEFAPEGGFEGRDRIDVRTYSPSIDEFQTDERSEFGIDLDFADRFDLASLPDIETVTFQQGVNGYSGTADTYLQEDQPDADNGAAAELDVDTEDPNVNQALLGFESVFGDGSRQVPNGAAITSATLRLETTGEGSGASLHRMLTDWSESDTWNSVENGVRANGIEAASMPDVATGFVSTGTSTIDVTESLRTWAEGASNYGWALLPSGGNGWNFSSAEGETPPELAVSYETEAGGTPIGEAGSVTVSQPDASTWYTVTLDREYTDPVVVMGPPSAESEFPLTVRVREVTDESFQFQLDEWEYLDGDHVAETVSYVVCEAGRHTLGDGTILRAETIGSVDHRWQRALFGEDFDATPAVFTQATSDDGPDAVVTRQRAVESDGFDVRLQEEEAGGTHTTETVGYLAVEPGTGTARGGTTGTGRFAAGVTDDTVTEDWSVIGFGVDLDSAPAFLAGMQTTDGGNTANVRYRRLDGSGVEVAIDEEQSADEETSHTTERVGYFAIEPGIVESG